MLKAIVHKIMLFYLAFIMLLASIAIPYTAHTCYISNQKDISVLSFKDKCHADPLDSCHSKQAHFDKKSCCGIEKGLIDFKTELYPSLAKSFVAKLSFVEIKLVLLTGLYSTNTTYAKEVHLQRDLIPLHIALQQFRC
ncbi:MAG: hypothetical protein R2772_07240 [Chitinophagales bacterium]